MSKIKYNHYHNDSAAAIGTLRLILNLYSARKQHDLLQIDLFYQKKNTMHKRDWSKLPHAQ